MLHSSKSFVFRKFVELKAPAEIQRAYSAYSNIVPAAIESLDHEAKGFGSQKEEGGGGRKFIVVF